jgi:cytochrome c oxidase assembly protein subunit 11
MSTQGEHQRSENRSMLWRLSAVAVLMFAFGYALVPFYDQICRALGINNLAVAEATAPRNSQVDRSRTVTVEFDANTHDLPWRFRALARHVTVHPGELAHVEFEVANVRDRAVTGQAVPSYGPQVAGQFFRKIECFCFTQQTLEAGETRRMPVVFAIDPTLPKDVGTVTLSYTFFEVPGKGGGA